MFAYYVNPTNKSYNFNYLRWKVNPLKHFLYRKNWLTAKAKEERRHLGCSHVLDEFLARRLRVISLSNETNFFINKHLLLTTKPKYMRGRVGCPNDTRPFNINLSYMLRKWGLTKFESAVHIPMFRSRKGQKLWIGGDDYQPNGKWKFL